MFRGPLRRRLGNIQITNSVRAPFPHGTPTVPIVKLLTTLHGRSKLPIASPHPLLGIFRIVGASHVRVAFFLVGMIIGNVALLEEGGVDATSALVDLAWFVGEELIAACLGGGEEHGLFEAGLEPVGGEIIIIGASIPKPGTHLGMPPGNDAIGIDRRRRRRRRGLLRHFAHLDDLGATQIVLFARCRPTDEDGLAAVLMGGVEHVHSHLILEPVAWVIIIIGTSILMFHIRMPRTLRIRTPSRRTRRRRLRRPLLPTSILLARPPRKEGIAARPVGRKEHHGLHRIGRPFDGVDVVVGTAVAVVRGHFGVPAVGAAPGERALKLLLLLLVLLLFQLLMMMVLLECIDCCI
mmetsp:Transcript_13644/g.28957  ORF Transcript_13644/g.28957 Transcript_13644/m.28957 type:complete len:351 (+) Transcript_13644:681-1733(+)